MRMYNYLLAMILSIFTLSDLMGQAIWTIKDPNGIDVTIDKDSSFLTIYNGYLLFYTINSTSGNRNILMANGDTSFWLLNEDNSLTSDFTPFISRKEDELVFRIGDVWYISNGSTETTNVFYDNNDPSNEYRYLQIFEFKSLSGVHHDLAIEAIDKSSGDTLTLLHRYATNTTDIYFANLNILQSSLLGVGSISGNFFVGAVYDSLASVWGDIGFYRQNSTGLRLLLPLGLKNNYHVQNIYYAGSDWTVDFLDNGEKSVYDYIQSVDSCIEITNSEFPGYTLLDVLSPKWPAWGPLYPNYPATSIEDLVWKGKTQNGSVRYFLRTFLGQEYEIVDLRNDSDVDFVYSHFHDDSIYYYNRTELNRGLVKTNFKNGMSVKESTSIQFDADFTLQGYNGKMYFGRYNSQVDAIQAMSKDFVNGNKYEFLESTIGERIDNPINFSFIDDRIFVHSRTEDGVKLVVFDPDGTVSVKPNNNHISKVLVAPNPSSGIFQIQLSADYSITSDWRYSISDDRGSLIKTGKLTAYELEVDLTNLPRGYYNLSIFDKNTIVSTVPLVLSGQ